MTFARRRTSLPWGAGASAAHGDDHAGPHADPDAEPDADPVAVARAICLRQLTLGPRSRSQLADVLRRRNVPDDVATGVLDRFVEVGLVDDAAFAETFVRSRVADKGLARRALAADLRARGIDDDTAAGALEQVTPELERVGAQALVRRRLPATRGLPAETRLRRLTGMLARKGYPGSVAFTVVREALAEEDADAAGALDALAESASGD